jgi:glycolate oxidase
MQEWYETEKKALKEIYQVTKELGGIINGEHGISSKRKPYMEIVCRPVELELMRKIKKAFDPNNIMNPGKIFDL